MTNINYSNKRKLYNEIHHERPMNIVIIVLTAIVLVITLFFNFLQFLSKQDNVGVFYTNISALSDKYSLDITPASWTFSIWGFIYIFQLAWVIYAHSLLCRTNKERTGLLYFDPPFLPPTVFIIYIFALILNTTWLFAFDSEFLVASYVIIMAMCICLRICNFFSFKLLWKYEKRLTKTEMWVNIVLVQNGIGLFCAWLEVATLLNSSIVFRYKVELSMYSTCMMALSIALIMYIAYFCFDVFYATTKLRYHLAPYLVCLVATIGILDKNWDSDSAVQTFVAAISGITGVGLFGKIASIVAYTYSKPLWIEQ